MAKRVELRRHTANAGDMLTEEGISAAVEIGRGLSASYDTLISSGAQRATQSLACMLAGFGRRVDSGVRVDPRFVSGVEARWYEAFQTGQGGDLRSFMEVDADLVEEEAVRFAEALRDVFDSLSGEGRAMVVGHSPMHEVAVYGLTGEIIDPIPKGGFVVVVQAGDAFSVESI